jgi:mannose-1-phosphate guanylyltransferase
MLENTYCVIMAGGVGSRFWPISRQTKPKQFLDILGTGKTFLQQTYERFLGIVPPENIMVVTNEQYRSLVAEQLPALGDEQILGEPLGRNTAPCIAYSAFRLRAISADAMMIVTPADHYITGEREFTEAITESVDFARTNNAMMTIGITPTRPDTGYGYIQIEGRREGINKVRTFTEKPNLELARVFVQSGEFFWNSGIFIWKNSVILDALASHLSDMYDLFATEQGKFGTTAEKSAVQTIYSESRSISIDFGVIEKADNVYVRCSNFGWSDVGTWNSLYQILPKDERGNVAPSGTILGDTEGSIVKLAGGKLAVLEGLSNFIVVDTDDVLLVWPRDREQEIKQITNALRYDGGEEYL